MFRYGQPTKANSYGQMHPKEQNILCPGCGEHFSRMAAFVCHLETGLCRTITNNDFISHVRHKHFAHKALQDPASIRKWDTKGEQDKAAEDSEDEGGVVIDFGGNIEAAGLQTPLEPHRKEYKVGPNVVEAFASLPTRPSRLDSRHVSDRSARSPGELEGSDDELETKMADLSFNGPEIDIKGKGRMLDPTPAEAAAGNKRVTAWTAGNRLAKSFSGSASAKVPAATPDMSWDDRFAVTEAENNKGNLLKDVSIANPDRPGFDVEKFYNYITEAYECPWASCDKSFKAVCDITHHLRYNHEAVDTKCPVCQKKFKSIHALVAHCEAINSRCYVKHTKGYGELINRVTGGFVNATIKDRDDVEFKQTKVEWDGSERTKIVSTSYVEYVSETPDGLRGISNKKDGQPELTQVTGANLGWVAPHMWTKK